MEMWRKQSTLMLFAAALAGVVISAQFSVILDQTQRQECLPVPLGSSLNLRCRLKIPQCQKFRVTFNFGKNLSDNVFKNIYDKVRNNSNPASTEELPFEEKYTLSNVTYEHAGWYFCNIIVEIPTLRVVNSSRRQVNITTKNLVEHTTYPPLVTSTQAAPPRREATFINWWMWIIVGASAFALLLLLVVCILLRRRCLKSRDPDPIYINTRPMVNKQPSPRPDNLKMAPASQHLRTPSPGRRYEEGNRKHRR